MRIWKVVLGGLLVLIGVPLVVAAGTVGWIALLDRTNGDLVSSGQERRYLLHVPDRHDRAEPTPLVISLHAGATWPAHQKNLSGWNALADEEGFLVVYPAGSDLPGVPGASMIASKMWHTFHPGAGLERDVRFIADLIDTLGTRYSIDPDRIFVNGMSNGGGMAYVLSCALSDRVAAVGIVAGAQALPPDWCAGGRAVPVIVFHGTADPIAPYAGGPLGDRFNPVKPVLPAVEEWVGSWARRNGCTERLRDSAVAGDVRRMKYAGCEDGAGVVLYEVEGGGHSWPGGKAPPEWRVGRTSESIDATREMWRFFLEHPRGGQARSVGDDAVVLVENAVALPPSRTWPFWRRWRGRERAGRPRHRPRPHNDRGGGDLPSDRLRQRDGVVAPAGPDAHQQQVRGRGRHELGHVRDAGDRRYLESEPLHSLLEPDPGGRVRGYDQDSPPCHGARFTSSRCKTSGVWSGMPASFAPSQSILARLVPPSPGRRAGAGGCAMRTLAPPWPITTVGIRPVARPAPPLTVERTP